MNKLMQDLFSLKGKKAIVTGGGRGIGEAITRGLCMAGAEVVIIGSSDKTQMLAEKLSGGEYTVRGITGDLSRTDEIEDIFAKAVDLLDGDIDILVNNAAIQGRYPAEDFPMKEWQKIIDLNLTATAMLCQLSGRIMLRKGYGKIINMASMTSFFGSYHIMAYAASKGGIAQLTKALSNEWSGRGINVNAIAPGGFRTQMTTALRENKETERSAMERTPAGRWGEPEDVTGTVIYLASKASDYVCGVILPVDGGYLVR